MCFREIEVEVRAKGRAGRRLLRAAISRLVAAGCRAEPPIPKVIRVLGQRASGPPDVVVPPIGAGATVDTLVRYAIARSVVQILRHDPGVRLGEDPEDVHQFRVATRRLRSDLRTFSPLLDPEPITELRGRPVPATTSYSIPWSGSPPGRRSPPSGPAWPVSRLPIWPAP